MTYAQVIHTVHKNVVKILNGRKKFTTVKNDSITSTFFCVYQRKHFVAKSYPHNYNYIYN